MGVARTVRLNEEIKRIISGIIQNDLKDPRIPIITSVTKVEVTKDLRYAKVYISVLGDDEEKEKCIEGLKSAAGYIRKEVGSKIKTYYTPEMVFVLDNSIEKGIEISKIISEMNKEKWY